MSLALINHYIVTNIYSIFTILYVVFVSLVKRLPSIFGNIVVDLAINRTSAKIIFYFQLI